jgi:ABC-type multidrug transport system fused ATPase/permease subunit
VFWIIGGNSRKNQLREKYFSAWKNGNVTLKNVAFSYPSRKEIKVLKDVNFTANFGQNCHRWSWSGKSTIASLLLRFTILIQVRY